MVKTEMTPNQIRERIEVLKTEIALWEQLLKDHYPKLQCRGCGDLLPADELHPSGGYIWCRWCDTVN